MTYTYHVPVYFKITAESSEEANTKICKELANWETLDQIPNYRIGIPWKEMNREALDDAVTRYINSAT